MLSKKVLPEANVVKWVHLARKNSSEWALIQESANQGSSAQGSGVHILYRKYYQYLVPTNGLYLLDIA